MLGVSVEFVTMRIMIFMLEGRMRTSEWENFISMFILLQIMDFMRIERQRGG